MHGETGPVTLKPVQSIVPLVIYLHLHLLLTAKQPKEPFGKGTEPETNCHSGKKQTTFGNLPLKNAYKTLYTVKTNANNCWTV